MLKDTFQSGRTVRLLDQEKQHAAAFSEPYKRISRGQLFWILQACGWFAFGAAMYTWGLEFMSPRDALVSKSLLVGVGVALTLLVRMLLTTLRKKSWNTIATIACIVGVSFTAAGVWREVHTLLFRAYYTGAIPAGLAPIPLGTFLYDGFVMLAWSLLYLAISNWMELQQERERAIKAEAMAQAARLRALQSQLEPHFLFNTLNSISTLVVDGKNGDAARMIAHLSGFLRLALETIDTPEIALVDELEFVRRYLQIEQVRFGPRLHVTIAAQPEAMSGMVPALLLQPLVENAVKHGVLTLEEGGVVSVTAERNNGTLRLSVQDSGPGLAQDRSAGRGVGLSNTASRLWELYGDASRISLRPSSMGGLEVTVEIPFRPARVTFTENGSSGDHA